MSARSIAILISLSGGLMSAGRAQAKDSPATGAKTLLAAQVAALNAHDAQAFAATFDDGAYLIFPTVAEASGRDAIAAAAKPWLAEQGGATFAADGARFGAFADADAAWISTEIVVSGKTTARWRVTELVTRRQPTPAGGRAGDELRVLAAHWSEPISDEDARAAVAKGTLPTLPAITNPTDVTQQLKIAAQVASDPAATAIGSAPRDLAIGKDAVAARLKAWQALAPRITEGTAGGDSNTIRVAGYVVAHATVTYQVKGKPVVVPYRVMLVTASPGPAGQGPTVIGFVHVSIAQRR